MSINVLFFVGILVTNVYFLVTWARYVLPILVKSIRRKVCGGKSYAVGISQMSVSQLAGNRPESRIERRREDLGRSQSPSPLDVEPGSVPNNSFLEDEVTTKKATERHAQIS